MPTARLLVPLLCLLVATLGVSCGNRETAVQAGNRQQILHWGNLAEPTDLDPQLITSIQDFNLVATLFEGLTCYDPKDLQPQPGVAERWSSSDDARAWTFHLRADARWSNGDPVTAHDFVFAYRRMLSPSLAAEYANMLFQLERAEEFYRGQVRDFGQVGVRASDDRTLILTLKSPLPYLPHLVSHSAWFPLHRPTLEQHGKVETRGGAWTRPGKHVGNGAFVLAEWKPHQVIRLKKSPTYWDRAAVRLNEVHVYPIESETAEEAAFRAGQLHLTAQVPLDKLTDYRNDPSGVLQSHTQLSTYFYRLNVNRPPLDDVRVRRALSMAVDRQQIVDRVVRAGHEPAGHFTPPGISGFTARAGITMDVPAARKLLADAGYPEGRGFPKLELLYNTTETHRKIAEAVQQMWKKHLGIEVTLLNQEARVCQDAMRQMNYQISRYAWSGDYLDPSTFLDIMTTGNGNNQTGWGNAEYDRLIAVARATGDNAQRHEYFQRCEEILTAEAPLVYVYFYKRNILLRPEVKGYHGNLLDLHPLKGVFLEASR